MTFRSFVVRWALRLYRPPFVWFYRLYYWLAIQISRIAISRVAGVRSIYLTGSWVRKDVVYGLSDIDFKILVDGAKKPAIYRSIRYRFELLRRFFPMLGSPDEKGVYFLHTFEQDYRHYPLVQHLFDSRFFRHQLIWGEDLIRALPIKPWKELDQDECTYGRLRDWIERIHLLADYDGLSAPQKQHLFFKAASDVALLALRITNPESSFSGRVEILRTICADIEEPDRQRIENLILENQSLYRNQLNSEDQNFRLFKRMAELCSERMFLNDTSEPSSIRLEQRTPLQRQCNAAIADTLRGFSASIVKVSEICWPQMPLNPFDVHLYNMPAYLLECSTLISLNEFHDLKAYCRKHLKDAGVVLLREYSGFLSSVDSTLVEHWGSFSRSSDLTHILLGDSADRILTCREASRIKARVLSFREQLAATLAHPEFGRIDLDVFPAFVFNALRMLIFDHELNSGRWQWHVTPDETIEFLIRLSPLKPDFLHRLAGQYAAVARSGRSFDERLLPKTRRLLAAMLAVCSGNASWKSLEKLNDIPDEEHLTMTVAIVTANRPMQLERCLRSILSLARMPEEIIVVDNGGGIPIFPIVEKFKGDYPICFLQCMQPGVAPARNMAARAAKGEIVVFVDDDACVAPDWLEHLERIFLRDPNVGLASGASLNMQCGRVDTVWKFMEAVEKL